jgi:hypothetical protein
MNQMYEKKCFCGYQIRMEEVNGKWGPYEIGTNDHHKCFEKKPETKQQQKLTVTLDSIDLRVTLIESILSRLGVQLK